MREYWILDIRESVIHVHDFETGEKDTYGFRDRIAVKVLDGLEIDFSRFRIKNPD